MARHSVHDILVIACVLSCVGASVGAGYKRSFGIDLERNTFVKDGVPFRYVSGSIHYFRVLPEYWEDRLRKIHAAGLDTIQVYVPWNLHQPDTDVYDFQGRLDLVGFLTLAQDLGLLVILRPGPYIDSEWDYGGFPYWLKDGNDSIVLRSMDPGYIRPVTRYFTELLPKLKPLLYQRGGPIIMIQIENEYGSYRGVTCDRMYLLYLRTMYREILGPEVVLFTTDGDGKSYLQCGTVPGAYATVDFGPGGNASQNFAPMREWNPKGPLVNSEFYPGWLTTWSANWSYTPTEVVTQSLTQMLDLGANVNIYLMFGGSNFGYMNGALGPKPYKPVVTSYDYDAPLSESGDTTHKYHAIRKVLSKYKPMSHDVPPNVSTTDFGTVHLEKLMTVLDGLDHLSPDGHITTNYPISMETARQAYGFALYRTKIPITISNTNLDLSGVRDRAYVMIQGRFVGKVYRNDPSMVLKVNVKAGWTLDIVVENMGRLSYGAGINHVSKGLTTNVTLAGEILTSWDYYRLDLLEAFNGIDQKHRPTKSPIFKGIPTVYRGQFTLAQYDEPMDTFLNTCGWGKGQAFINGFNLGRYWPTAGPQVTLYIPGVLIQPYPHVNTLVLLELQQVPAGCNDAKEDASRNSVKDFLLHKSSAECGMTLESRAIFGATCTGGNTLQLGHYDNKTDFEHRHKSMESTAGESQS